MNAKLQDIREKISAEVEKIKDNLLNGRITLLETELVPLFVDLKNSLNIENIFPYSELFKEISLLLAQKFEELQKLINSLGKTNVVLQFLENEPSEATISQVLRYSWISPFNLPSISQNYLDKCKRSLVKERESHLIFEHPDMIKKTRNFFLEMPEQNFIEKMNNFYNNIKDSLPCPYELIFKDETNQEKLFENFVYFLHLLQSGKLKYQKETNSIYY